MDEKLDKAMKKKAAKQKAEDDKTRAEIAALRSKSDPGKPPPTPKKKFVLSPLYPCRDCGAEISRKAKTCPHCGLVKRDSAIGVFKLFLLLFFILTVFIAGAGAINPQYGGPHTIGFYMCICTIVVVSCCGRWD